jgi:hypothetical protein
MEINRLRSIIRESINNNLKEIEDVAENAAMEAKLNAYTEAIEKVNKKIEMAESLEEMQELVDPAKLNELKKHLKELQKSKEKLEKLQEKKNKGKKVVTDEPTDEPAVEEGDKYNTEDNWNDAEVDDPFNAGIAKNQPMDEEETINESFLKMQKLAGVITEAQYNQKKRLIENEVTKEITPEEAAQMVAAKTDELKNNPTIKKIAANLIKDPKAKKQLIDLAKKSGIDVGAISENENIKDIIYKLSLGVAKKAEGLTENHGWGNDGDGGGGDVGGGVFGGLALGGAIMYWIAPYFDSLHHISDAFFNKGEVIVNGGPVLLGAIVGSILGLGISMLVNGDFN